MAATDANLVRACLGGEVEAFGELVERYRDAVYGLCYARVGDFELARDLAQDSFISAYRALGQLRDPERFPAWLRRIADNACKAALRRGRSSEESLADDRLPAAGDAADEVSVRLTVQAALRSLPANNRVVLSLFYINGYTCDEIGKFLSVPASTVKGRLRAGRARLRRRLAPLVREMFREKALPPDFGGKVMQLIREVKVKQEPPVMLLVDDRGKALPMWIGEMEASSLAWALGGHQLPDPRPLTYDLFLGSLSAFGVHVERAEIVEQRDDGAFIAALVLTKGKQERRLDARPSDAINLAVRAKAPILVTEVLAETMMERAAAEQEVARLKPLAELGEKGREAIERVAHVTLERAVREKADVITLGPDWRAEVVRFVVGGQSKEMGKLPRDVARLLSEHLAQMAGIKLKPEARSQTARLRIRLDDEDRVFRVTFSQRGTTIKPLPADK